MLQYNAKMHYTIERHPMQSGGLLAKEGKTHEPGGIMKKKEMRAQELETILDSIADGVFTIDLNNNITSFNKAAERITGIAADQAIGQKCFDVFHSNICQGSCVLEKTLRTEKQYIDLPVNIINNQGSTIPISVSTAVLKNKRGRIIGGVETFRDLSAIEQMRREIQGRYTFHDIVSKNHDIHNILSVLPEIAASGSTVLIQGPSGAGKELVARAIHNLSTRNDSPYIAVNCGALPDTLLESELFGYVKGAFTDAKKNKPGRFALAAGGTLFLDEIGDLSIALQIKLLRVLQEGEYEPLGSTKTVKARARIITATNKDLKELMAQGRFRDDLYYRLNVIKIELPPLAQRKEDIPLLVDHFIGRLNIKKGRKITGVSRDVMQALLVYDFPGNIRELENIIEHGFVLCPDFIITLDHLPADFKKALHAVDRNPKHSKKPLRRAEAEALKKVLDRHGGHRGKTARELGIDRSTLWRKMKKYRLISDEQP